MKYIFTFLLFLLVEKNAVAQLYAGAGYGSFHVRGESDRVMGSGPTLKIDYVGYENEDQQVFLDVSLYKKSFEAGETEIYDSQGTYIGDAGTTQTYSITHVQLGFKRSLAGNFTKSKFNFFLSGGGALSFVIVNLKYSYPGQSIANDKIKDVIYGFHFGLGTQFRIDPVVLELRGNFDFLVKPIEIASGGNSYFLSSTRLCVIFPLTKKMKRGI